MGYLRKLESAHPRKASATLNNARRFFFAIFAPSPPLARASPATRQRAWTRTLRKSTRAAAKLHLPLSSAPESVEDRTFSFLCSSGVSPPARNRVGDMNRLVFFIAVFGLCASPAYARTVHLRGDEADAFITKNFPDAEIPGEVKGKFTYIEHGHKRVGHAVMPKFPVELNREFFRANRQFFFAK